MDEGALGAGMSDNDVRKMQELAKAELEKRRFERLRAALQIKYRPVVAEEEALLVKQGGYAAPESFKANTPEIKDFSKVVSEDLSLGGVRIAAPVAMPPGTRLWLQISLPDAPIPINAIAEVRWNKAESVGGFSHGLKFVSVSKPDLDKVERYLVLQKRAEIQKKQGL
jgi:c-di-GMP-binding flagellar brake protein YcgR